MMSAMDTLIYEGTLTGVVCWCGTHHAVPSELAKFQAQQHRDGRAQTRIYCPHGHAHVRAGEGAAAKLERDLADEREYAARLLAEREQADASARAYRGVATKARKRAAAALCPCCGRSFVQIRRHMASKHPGYLAEHGITPDPDAVA